MNNIYECRQQLKSLIEHFENGGLDFNATDIEAIKFLITDNIRLEKESIALTERNEFLMKQEYKLINLSLWLEAEISRTRRDNGYVAMILTEVMNRLKEF